MSPTSSDGKEGIKGKIIDRRGIGEGKKVDPIMIQDEELYPPIPLVPDYSKINLSMQGDRMLIQPFPHAKKIGRILTPQNFELAIDKGRVVGVGPGVKKIKVGDVIYKVAGLGQMLIDSQGNSYIFLPENAAIAVDLSYRKKWWKSKWPLTVEGPILPGDPDMPSTVKI